MGERPWCEIKLQPAPISLRDYQVKFYKVTFLSVPSGSHQACFRLGKNRLCWRLLYFIFFSGGAPDCGSLGEKPDTQVTRADSRDWEYLQKRGAVGIAALELGPVLTTHMLENFGNIKTLIFFFLLLLLV